ncbi:dTDP-glucose 4,6-dehydratase [Photobacterium phosphoreum]|uniref:SDR family oxidoreductase n=1 Tax=Photobacterium phosphoreum TaxID=659 RepID=UPI000D17C727|nr:SDR family oxidoreductase [Photobacterium phosphoreum]PSU68066.1 dTDP-glucose 4,6-dehydratase [Photobacterium phosphoreum]
MSKFTVFGGRGFIGSEFVKELKTQGHDVFVPEKDDISIYDIDLGTVIYCAGYGDCQKDPFNVLTANVILLSTLLQKAKFNKLVYISSTRVYMNQELSNENSNLTICENDSRRLFNLTKLTAEELCLKSNRDCLIVRPSNVYGLALNSTLFLPSIIRNAINDKKVDMYVDKSYSKDYVSVENLVDCTLKLIRLNDLPNIINIASGVNIRADEIINTLVNKTDCTIEWHDSIHIKESFPVTSIINLNEIMFFKFDNVLNVLEIMIDNFKRILKSE